MDESQKSKSSPRTIAKVLPLRYQPGRLRIVTDLNESLDLTKVTVAQHGLREGNNLSAALWNELELGYAYDVALSLLARSERSDREMRERLRRRKISKSVIQSTLARLLNEGLIDDARYSQQWVEFRARTAPRGRALLAMELRRKGVKSEHIDSALAKVTDDNEQAQCMRLIESRLPRMEKEPDQERAKRRLLSFLARRGFSYETIRQSLREVVPDWE